MSTELAVDGGQTGLRMALVLDGLLSDVICTKGFAYQTGVEPADTMAACVAEGYYALGSPTGVERICLGLTGAPGESERRHSLAVAISEAVGGADVWLGPDFVTSHAGALVGAAGVVISAGTGVDCLGIGHDGEVHVADGHGYLLGDDGSGFSIGRAALRAVMAARDGRGPETPLVDAAVDALGDLDRLGHRLYTSNALVTTVARCAAWVADVARLGDPVAKGIWQDAVDALVHTTATVVQRAFPDAMTGSVPVSHAGGLFRIDDLVRQPFVATLADTCARAQPQPPKGGSLDGAVHMLSQGLGHYRPLIYTLHSR